MKNYFGLKKIFIAVGLLLPFIIFSGYGSTYSPRPIAAKLMDGVLERRETIIKITPKNIPLKFKIKKVNLYNDGRLFDALILLNYRQFDNVYFQGEFIGYKRYIGGVDALKIEGGKVYKRVSEDSWEVVSVATEYLPIKPTYFDKFPKEGGTAKEWVVKGKINNQPFIIRGGHRVPFLTFYVKLGVVVFSGLTLFSWVLWLFYIKKFKKENDFSL